MQNVSFMLLIGRQVTKQAILLDVNSIVIGNSKTNNQTEAHRAFWKLLKVESYRKL